MEDYSQERLFPWDLEAGELDSQQGALRWTRSHSWGLAEYGAGWWVGRGWGQEGCEFEVRRHVSGAWCGILHVIGAESTKPPLPLPPTSMACLGMVGEEHWVTRFTCPRRLKATPKPSRPRPILWFSIARLWFPHERLSTGLLSLLIQQPCQPHDGCWGWRDRVGHQGWPSAGWARTLVKPRLTCRCQLAGTLHAHFVEKGKSGKCLKKGGGELGLKNREGTWLSWGFSGPENDFLCF